MNIETAEHRLLEVLVSTELNRGRQGVEAGDPLLALSIGLSCARNIDAQTDADGPIGPVLAALEDLVLAVRSEVHQAHVHEPSAVQCRLSETHADGARRRGLRLVPDGIEPSSVIDWQELPSGRHQARDGSVREPVGGEAVR
jgi:hypothetical protein